MRTLAIAIAVRPDWVRETLRIAAAVLLGAVELLLVSLFFGFTNGGLIDWHDPVAYAISLARLGVLAFVLFVMVAWPMRADLLALRERAGGGEAWRLYLALNLALFAVLMLVKRALAIAGDGPMELLLVYSGLLLATGASLALLIAPLRFWVALPRKVPVEIAVAVIGAAIVLGASRLAQEGWSTLSDATLALSHWLLTLYEPGVFLDYERKILGVGDFRARIYAPCSGYEGAALISVFLTIYIWAFRRELRFPNVLLLFPIGIATIWVFNAIRIAALISIGAHVSPEVAVEGFHSQAGWISFLVVTVASIALSRRVAFFAARAPKERADDAPADVKSPARITLEFLAPFMALMAGSVVAAAFVPHDQWLYGLKVAGVTAVLLWFRGAYVPFLRRVSFGAVAAGSAVGLLWIATDPGAGRETPLGLWLAALPVWLAVVWLLMRAVGSVILVPVAEELAFRGYLHRALISSRFESVPFGKYRPLAFVVSTVAFAFMHERWLAAGLAGAVYALLMYRSNRLSDPIAAHVASNAVIMAWAIACAQWSLL